MKMDTIINGSMKNGSLSNGGSKDCSLSTKRNRSLVVYSRRKIRQRPLTKVLESAVMVSVPVTCDELVNSDSSPPRGYSESKASAVIKNSDSNGVLCENVSVSLNAAENVVEAIYSKAKENEISNISLSAKDDSSNGLFDVPLIGEENYSAGIIIPTEALVSGQTRRFGQSSHSDVVKNKGSNGSGCTNPAATLFNEIERSTLKWQLKGKRSSRQMSKKERRNAFVEANNCLPHFSFGTRAMGRTSELYNVKIEVKANYKPQNVPFVSLRSKLNGGAIVGHPLMVDLLEDGSCDRIVSNHLKPLGVQSSKKKAKKKKSHIPLYDKPSKSMKSSSLSIKTRSLSALSSQKLTASSKKKMLIEISKERTVACIPLKVVFSRINEGLKGSTRQVHRSLPSAGST